MGATRKENYTLPPCREACPAGVNVPVYIRYIRQGKFDEALSVIRESIPFPAVCGYACIHPCETKCARAQYDQPLAIRMLKRSAAEIGGGLWKQNVKIAPSTGKKAAVVGAGPCGLTAAYYLAGKGHRVTVYEAMPEAGGMMRYGIPSYRLPGSILDAEIAEIAGRGITIKTGTRIDSAASLLREGYNAVFLASGAWQSSKLGMAGEEMPVIDGISFLQDVNNGTAASPGQRVAVIGGGNTAIDAARSAVRLGAGEVVVIYRRALDQMPAGAEEIAGALEEGVIIECQAAPVKAARGRLTCVRTKPGSRDAGGRPAPVPVEGSEFTIAADAVIVAIGQKADPLVFNVAGDPDGTIQVNADTLATSMEGVFAAGDAVTGPSSIIQAVAQGKRAAGAIDRYLGGDGDIHEALAPGEMPGAAPAMPMGTERAFTRTIPYGQRLNTFQAVETPFSENVARREARRCLGCDVTRFKVEVDYAACKACGYCLEVCRPGVFDPAGGFNDRGYKPMQAAHYEKCVGCYKCFFVCPDFAISIEKAGEAD